MLPASCSRTTSERPSGVSGGTSTVEAMDWLTYRNELRPRRRTAARRALTARYQSATSERFDLGQCVGATLRAEPLYAVVPYQEAFSPALVREVLELSGVRYGALLDPFVGAGTSLLVGAEHGLTVVGVDILPFSAFASRTLLSSPTADWDIVDRALSPVLSHSQSNRGHFPNFPVRSWAFGPAALTELCDLDAAISAMPAGVERDVMRLALLSSVELMSQATKDGTSLRKRPHGGGRNGRFGTRHTRAHVQAAFRAKLELLREGAGRQPKANRGSTALAGDARDLPALLDKRGTFDVAVFSPPYPNRYDYVGNYQLELGFGFVPDVTDLRDLREGVNSARTSKHHGAPTRTLELDALDEFFSAYLASSLRGQEAGRVFRMVSGYFEDMSLVLSGLHHVMRPGSVVSIVVGTQVFGGEQLPTDLLLAEIAELHGFSVKEIWNGARKGHGSPTEEPGIKGRHLPRGRAGTGFLKLALGDWQPAARLSPASSTASIAPPQRGRQPHRSTFTTRTSSDGRDR